MFFKRVIHYRDNMPFQKKQLFVQFHSMELFTEESWILNVKLYIYGEGVEF